MIKSLSIFFTLSVMLQASFFLVIDKKGNILKKRELTHTQNAYLSQSATEYSYQAIFDELHKEEHMALLAQAAKERIERISREKEAARERGEVYRLTTADQTQLIKDAHYFKGGKYVWGGTTPEGFDCSGYVQYLFKKHKIDLPRTAWSQSKLGKKVELAELKTGDLLFFNTDKKRGIPISHVGIYIGSNKFIHAASRKKGIIISPLAGHYRECFIVAKRIIAPDTAAKKIASLH